MTKDARYFDLKLFLRRLISYTTKITPFSGPDDGLQQVMAAMPT